MGYLTKYGSFWGLLPLTAGRVFWVAPTATYTVEGRTYSASDNQDGLSPERALLTLTQALLLVSANVGDVIVMLPGAHSYSATIAVNIAGITITGLPNGGPMHGPHTSGGPARNRASITNTATAGIILTVSVDDVEIAWLDFIPVAAGGVAIYNTVGAVSGSGGSGADRTYIHDCTVGMVAASATSTYGIQIGTAATGVAQDIVIRNCLFTVGDAGGSNSAQGPGVVAIGTAYACSIEHCTFQNKGTGAWAIAIQSLSAGTAGCIIRDCDFLNSSNTTSVITTAVNTSSTTIDAAWSIWRCYIAAGTDVATATAIVDIGLAETYLASSGGGALANNN